MKPDPLLEDVRRIASAIEPICLIEYGSTVKGEQCALVDANGSELYLSDIDVLCVVPEAPHGNVVHSVCEQLWNAGGDRRRLNPYYHIGFKIRTPAELDRDIRTQYVGDALRGRVISGRADVLRVLGNRRGGTPSVDDERIAKDALTRLWRNLLFFPKQSLDGAQSSAYRVWYAYMLARGALDWVRLRLLRDGIDLPSYAERLEAWRGLSCRDIPSHAAERWFRIKTGQETPALSQICQEIFRVAEGECQRYVGECSWATCLREEAEFLVSMQTALRDAILARPTSVRLRDVAHRAGYGVDCDAGDAEFDWPTWRALRREYWRDRLRRSPMASRDHGFTAVQFLRIGDGHGRN
ncbi:hypothetical protein H8D73_02290 [bacterium]|nr:hypothetical protein [bacterium]